MLPRAQSYQELVANFVWEVPEFYNIGVDVCDKWADTEPDRRALTIVEEDGVARDVSFAVLKAHSNQIANLLSAHGAKAGDRIGIMLPQSEEAATSQIAVYKMGAIAVPLFILFGPEALQHRIVDAGIKIVFTNQQGAEKLRAMDADAQKELTIFCVDHAEPELKALDFQASVKGQSEAFAPVNTRADDPAVIIYTSGTTGAPKGALHAHRVLLGHLPGMEMSHEFFPQLGDVIWTPADWAWIGGLLDVLLPALHHGVPVIARRFQKFTAEAAFELLSRFNVTNAFIPPTALKLMRAAAEPNTLPLKVRTIGSGGEALGAELLSWARDTFGVTINEFYGQTECNLIVSSCSAIMDARPGIMGCVVPGHELTIRKPNGELCARGEQGAIAVKKGDPVMFLRYWNKPQATAEKFVGNWLYTGDIGIDEGDGWIRFVGRDDDVITSAGYRMGPGEIEDCIMQHPAVASAAVVGKADPLRTQIVKAYVVLRDGRQGDAELRADIQAHVRDRLAAHEYPREIEFVSDLPVTNTGKIIRRVLRERADAEAQGTAQ